MAPPSKLQALAAAKALVISELGRLHESGNILGAVLIATCNRFELLIDQQPDNPIDPESLLPASDLEFLRLEDRDAVGHLLRVTAGLESMVAGEEQIIGQVRRAFKDSEDLGLLSRNLNMLRNRLMASARDVRKRSGLSANRASLPALGADLLLEHSSRIAVVGAGETARIAVQTLRRKFAGDLWIINRSIARAERLAQHFDAKAMSLEEFLLNPADVDGILFAVYSDRSLLAPMQIPGLKVAVDLSMPSVLDSELNRQANLSIWDLDSITERAASEAESRRQSLTVCRKLAESQTGVLYRDLLSDKDRFSGIIALHVESAIAEFEHASRSQLSHLSNEDRELVRKVLVKAAKRNAHYHLKDLRSLAVETAFTRTIHDDPYWQSRQRSRPHAIPLARKVSPVGER